MQEDWLQLPVRQAVYPVHVKLSGHLVTQLSEAPGLGSHLLICLYTIILKCPSCSLKLSRKKTRTFQVVSSYFAESPSCKDYGP